MAEEKEIICLANSRKPSGRCIAGKDEISKTWIRPISDRPTEEVSEYEREYEDGTDPQVLDTIVVPVLSAKPNPYQPENWLLNPDYYWQKTGRKNWRDLRMLADSPGRLWKSGSQSSTGLNNRVDPADARNGDSSLYLIYLSDCVVRVEPSYQKRIVQAAFTYEGISYDLRITDPVVERKYRSGNNGEFHIGECYLTVSLGEPYDDGYCYKFAAAIITPEGARA